MNAYYENVINLLTTKMAQKYFKISNPHLEGNNISILSFKGTKQKSVCTNNVYFQRSQKKAKSKQHSVNKKFKITISIIYLLSA